MCNSNTGISKRKEKKLYLGFLKFGKDISETHFRGFGHRSRKILLDFDIEMRAITAKYNKAGYPWQFIQSVI